MVVPPLAAEMVALIEEATLVVLTVKVAVVAPAATVTLAGTVAEALPLDKATVNPLAGATPLRVTVPVEETPPRTLVGFKVRPLGTGARIVRTAVLVMPPVAAEIVDVVLAAITEVEIVKVAEVAPAATETVAGTVAEGLLLDSATIVPPEGAAPDKVTVPVELLPPRTLVGLKDKVLGMGAAMLSTAVLLEPLTVAVMFAVVDVPTRAVVVVKVAVVEPALTVTDTGTVALGLSLERETTVPPVGAAAANVTLPIEELPPTTLAGFNVKAEIIGVIVSVALDVMPP